MGTFEEGEFPPLLLLSSCDCTTKTKNKKDRRQIKRKKRNVTRNPDCYVYAMEVQIHSYLLYIFDFTVFYSLNKQQQKNYTSIEIRLF